MITKFPYKCFLKNADNFTIGDTFIPTMIDYENEMVWRQKGQASDNGEWIAFEDLIFINVENFVDLSDSRYTQ